LAQSHSQKPTTKPKLIDILNPTYAESVKRIILDGSDRRSAPAVAARTWSGPRNGLEFVYHHSTENSFCLGLLVICCVAEFVPMAFAENPYAKICQRNLFHLRPLPVAHSEPATGPLPKVHLTGITTIWPGKRALFKVEFPAKPAEKPKEESYILKEGQKEGPIEVLEINVQKEQVKVDNSGNVTTLTFEKTKPVSSPPAVQPTPPWRGLPTRRFYR
jgi:hypothetical protein